MLNSPNREDVLLGRAIALNLPIQEIYDLKKQLISYYPKWYKVWDYEKIYTEGKIGRYIGIHTITL